MSANDVIGTFKLKSPTMAGTLTLNANNTFTQTFALPTGTAASSGKWALDQNGNVVLYGGCIVDFAHSSVTAPAGSVGTISAIRSVGGSVRLTLDDDLPAYYE